MWCRMLLDGAHHSCWLLLQALFMIASVLTAMSMTVTRTITKGAFIVTSLSPELPVEFPPFKLNPR